MQFNITGKSFSNWINYLYLYFISSIAYAVWHGQHGQHGQNGQHERVFRIVCLFIHFDKKTFLIRNHTEVMQHSTECRLGEVERAWIKESAPKFSSQMSSLGIEKKNKYSGLEIPYKLNSMIWCEFCIHKWLFFRHHSSFTIIRSFIHLFIRSIDMHIGMAIIVLFQFNLLFYELIVVSWRALSNVNVDDALIIIIYCLLGFIYICFSIAICIYIYTKILLWNSLVNRKQRKTKTTKSSILIATRQIKPTLPYALYMRYNIYRRNKND